MPVMKREFDTIAAPLTSRGEAAVSLIRISGPGAVSIVSQIFKTGHDLVQAPSHTALLGDVLDSEGHCMDRALLTLFRAPASYTGEDVAELSLHGSPLLTDLVMDRLQEKGARFAEPGEFTRRAFINGKLTLVEAEAVADLISAKTPGLLTKAAANLKGELDRKLRELTGRMTGLLASLNLSLDFEEEFLNETDWNAIREGIASLLDDISREAENARNAIREKNGLHILILGPPNAGKSTLMNTLLGHERVLVSDTPGTTRDYITEPFFLDGHALLLIDTAGIRGEEAGELERLGISKSLSLVEKSDIIIYMTEAGSPSFKIPEPVNQAGVPVIPVASKWDRAYEGRPAPDFWLPLSAVEGFNMEALKEKLSEEAGRLTQTGGTGAVLLNRRQLDHLLRAREDLEKAAEAVREGAYEEVVSDFVRQAAEELEMLTGKRIVEEMLNQIFDRFCIGK